MKFYGRSGELLEIDAIYWAYLSTGVKFSKQFKRGIHVDTG